MKQKNLKMVSGVIVSAEPLTKTYTLKLNNRLIDYLRNNPDGIPPSTYLRKLLVSDVAQNCGGEYAKAI
jgi:hypothetical protein